MRLEGVAPFGPPAFILAARDDAAILLLPRDERVVRGANAAEILDALTGVDLSPGDLQAVLTGCVTPSPDPVSGRQHEDDVVSITLVDGAVVYLRRQDGVWRPLGARRQGWEIEYAEWLGSFPRSVRLRSAGPGATVDVTAALSQLETNVVLEPAAFTVDVPPGADPLSLDELRAGGPLRGES
jgi:hypothetical protein